MARPVKDTGWASTVWYDPGGTTGWCTMSFHPKDLLCSNRAINKALQHMAAGQIVGSEHEQVDQLVELVDIWPDAAFGGESFHQRIRDPNLETGQAYSPVRINAIVKWWLATEDRFLFKQSPGDAKRAWNDDQLRRMGWWLVGEEHARDAVRHAALFINRVREKPKMRATAWPHLYNPDGSLK